MRSVELVLCLCLCLVARGEGGEREARLVRSPQGPVKGYKDPGDSIFVFYGIPYATAPTGADKFKTMKYLSTLFLAAALAAVAHAQFPNGRILEPPVPSQCVQRVIHERYADNKGYFFSWRDPALRGVEEDWLSARNYCRQRCMDLVSLETSDENEWVKARIVQDKVKYIWTSGRLCDFKGCNRPDLLPNDVNGWFWTAELQKLAPTTNRQQNDWSEGGGIGKPQPDNRELIQGGASEHCLAILNNFYNDGVHWHDVACHHRKPFVCEENDALLKYVRYTNPNLRV